MSFGTVNYPRFHDRGILDSFGSTGRSRCMRIIVHAKPSTKVERVEGIGPHEFIVAVKEPPREGRANAAIIGALAEHFGVPSSRVRLVSGFTSRQKIFDVDVV